MLVNPEEKIATLLRENEELRRENKELREQVAKLNAFVEELQGRLNKNSTNSSKPPSSDSRRTQSLRKSSGKPAGGQPGHKGQTLQLSENPDQIVRHEVTTCRGCGKDLSATGAHRWERRQIYDIPPVSVVITEHQAEVKQCPCCRAETVADFPETVSRKVAYGKRIKGLGVYLTQYQLLPFRRSAELIEDLFDHRISNGSLVSFSKHCSGQLTGFTSALKAHLRRSDVVHSDETGFRYGGKRQWLHVATTEDSTFYMPHAKRGTEAMDAMGILPGYGGINMHDYWKSYLSYGCGHALCNAHHLRDLTWCHEQQKSEWAGKMIELLLLMKAKVDQAKSSGRSKLGAARRMFLSQKYDELIKEGYRRHPLPEKPPGKRGRLKKTKTQNMLVRFDEHKQEVLRFMNDFRVPFDNNLAERAIRMMRLKQKISGCFRSEDGAKVFASIRSYIDTMRKNGIRIMDALELAIRGKPCMSLFNP